MYCINQNYVARVTKVMKIHMVIFHQDKYVYMYADIKSDLLYSTRW